MPAEQEDLPLQKKARILALCLSALTALSPLAHAQSYTQSQTAVHAGEAVVSGTRAHVDFAYLASLNPDCVGWLYQEDTALNQPVMYTDTDRYTKWSFENTRLATGTVYADPAGTGLADPVCYLFGNRAEEGPFVSLPSYVQQTYYDEHPTLRLLTPQGDRLIRLFAVALTDQSDNESWRVPTFSNGAAFDAWVGAVAAQSPVTPHFLPVWGDRLTVLVTNINSEKGKRYVLYGASLPIRYDTDALCDLVKAPLDTRVTRNGYVTVPPLGTVMVYAQNDPLWDALRYEGGDAKTYRHFGDGACGPTAVAVVLSNLLAPEELPAIGRYTADGEDAMFCTCSVNRYYCTHQHVPYRLQTPEEYLRYLPVAVANFAAGNNRWDVRSRRGGVAGTNMRFLPYLCEVYGLEMTLTRDMDEVLAALRNGAMAVACAIRKSPFTNTSHYVALAGADDQYLYIIDPYRRSDYYGMEDHEIIEILASCVVRVKLEDIDRCNLTPMYVMQRANEGDA